jgi:hypothetical protein
MLSGREPTEIAFASLSMSETVGGVAIAVRRSPEHNLLWITSLHLYMAVTIAKRILQFLVLPATRKRADEHPNKQI